MRTSKLSICLLASLSLPLAPASAGPTAPYYEVPVTPELAPWARFALPDLAVARDPGLRLAYSLPVELVGRTDLRVVLTLESPAADGASAHLVGELGEADCARDGAALRCTVTYRDLGLDEALVRRVLEERVADTGEREARWRVAREFALIPVGIVVVPGWEKAR